MAMLAGRMQAGSAHRKMMHGSTSSSGRYANPRSFGLRTIGARGRRDGGGPGVVCRGFFGGGDDEASSQLRQGTYESTTASQEILLLLVEQELNTQLTRALNMEQFDAAKEIRRRSSDISTANRQLLEEKCRRADTRRARKAQEIRSSTIKTEAAAGESIEGGSGADLPPPATMPTPTPTRELSEAARQEAVDTTAEGVRLRTLLQTAIENEDYTAAAEYRDRLKALEVVARENDMEAIAAAVEEDHAHKIGEWVFFHEANESGSTVHGVVCGIDSECGEDDEWMEKHKIPTDATFKQDYYLILVHSDRRILNESLQPPSISYVPESFVHGHSNANAPPRPAHAVRGDAASRFCALGLGPRNQFLDSQ